MQRSDSLSALSVQQNQIACIPSLEFNFIYASERSGSLVALRSLEKKMNIQTGRNLHFCLISSRMSAGLSLCELGTASILFVTRYPQHATSLLPSIATASVGQISFYPACSVFVSVGLFGFWFLSSFPCHLILVP